MEPYEIIMAPFEIWLAPVSTAFPDVDETPAGDWELLGTNGLKNMDEAGVVVTHSQTIEKKRTLGSTGAVKAARTEEDMSVGFTLVDLSLEQYAKVLNDVTVTPVAKGVGTPGYRSIPLRQGRDVAVFALLAKGVSPYGDTYAAQYQIPICYQSASPTPTFVKGDAAALECLFEALEDPDAASDDERFGVFVAQDDVAGT